jgi:ATF/CREB family transcription factor
VTQLREEIVNLKSLLLAHRDCPVSAAQGIGGASMNMFLEGGHHANPYGMAAPQPNGVPQGIPMMTQGPGGQMQRRFVLESFYPENETDWKNS